MSEMIILQCAGSCEAFQVHNKRSQARTAKGIPKPIKWQCKICGVKQSLKKIFFQGTGKECRINVQHLNMNRANSLQTTHPQEPGFTSTKDEYTGENSPENPILAPETDDEVEDRIYKKPRLDDTDFYENTSQESQESENEENSQTYNEENVQENNFSSSIFSECLKDDSDDAENEENIQTYNEENVQENDFSSSIFSECLKDDGDDAGNEEENSCSENIFPSPFDNISTRNNCPNMVDNSYKKSSVENIKLENSVKTSIFEHEDDDVNDLLDF